MKKTMALAVVAACAGTAMAQAPFSVMLMAEESITESAQTFTFTFDMLPGAISAGSLTIDALGDYNPIGAPTGQADETIDWDIDGIASGMGFDPSAFDDPDNVDLFQNRVTQTYNISEADMAAITADGTLTITVQNGINVGTFEPDDFVKVSLEYRAVPAPAGAALLGLGGLAAARRRR